MWRFLTIQYGIPGVLGVGNGTKRIVHGQTITIDGDAGIVMIHGEDGEFVPDGSGFSDVAMNNPHVSGGQRAHLGAVNTLTPRRRQVEFVSKIRAIVAYPLIRSSDFGQVKPETYLS